MGGNRPDGNAAGPRQLRASALLQAPAVRASRLVYGWASASAAKRGEDAGSPRPSRRAAGQQRPPAGEGDSRAGHLLASRQPWVKRDRRAWERSYSAPKKPADGDEAVLVTLFYGRSGRGGGRLQRQTFSLRPGGLMSQWRQGVLSGE